MSKLIPLFPSLLITVLFNFAITQAFLHGHHERLPLHSWKKNSDYNSPPLFATSSPDENYDATSGYYYRPSSSRKTMTPKCPPDMIYNEDNVRRSASTFQSIRSAGGVGCTNDVYARNVSTLPYQFFYIGKMARCDGILPSSNTGSKGDVKLLEMKAAVARMWNLMEEHACRLRPVELGRGYGTDVLEIWVSKIGDTELEMSQAQVPTGNGDNNLSLEDMTLIKMPKSVLDCEQIDVKTVGFMAEVVTNQGEGFFIVRDGEGKVMV